VAEYYMHFGGLAVPSYDSTLATFEKSIALDPTFGPYYVHAVDLAIVTGDSARAAELLDVQQRAAPNDDHHPGSRLAFDLVFGDDSTREATWARQEARLMETGWVVVSLSGLGQARLRERAAEIAVPAGVEYSAGSYNAALRSLGRLRDVAEFVHDRYPAGIAEPVLILRAARIPVYLEAWRPPAPDAAERPAALMSLGLAAIEGDRDAPTLNAVLAETDRRRQSAAAAGDAVEAGRWAALAGALDAYSTWQAGDAGSAVPGLEGALAGMPAWSPGTAEWVLPASAIVWWLGEANAELGRLDQATQHFQRFFATPGFDAIAQYRLGDLYERLDRPDDARRAYAAFLDAWQNADPELQPMVDHARERLSALTGEG
jgi:tetratricopeptide (TPR) repeat protein